MKEEAVEMRDKLNKMASESLKDNPDMQGHIIACCLAVAIEELEKWIYEKEEWTPSVRPYIDNREFEIPYPKGKSDDEVYSGPPWKRKEKEGQSFEERFPTMSRMKKNGDFVQPVTSKTMLSALKLKKFDDWDIELRDRFREGDIIGVKRRVRLCTRAPIRQINDFVKESIRIYPFLWEIDQKPGNICPCCLSKNIEHRTRTGNYHLKREYCCRNCNTQWGITDPHGNS